MTLSLRQLRYFIAIAEAGALSHAAQVLNIAQSALSHHVSQLEADLGVKLIERQTRGITLTAAGTRLYEHARTIVGFTRTAEADVRTFSEDATGSITVGFPHTTIGLAALPLMQAVRRECPRVALNIVEGVSWNLAARVASGEIDLALAYNPVTDPRLDRRPLINEPIYLIGRPELIGHAVDPIRCADLPDHPIFAPYASGSLRALVERNILRHRGSQTKLIEFDSLLAMQLAVESGLGCSMISRACMLEALTTGRVQAREIVEPRLIRTLEQISLREHPKTRAFLMLQEMLTSAVLSEVSARRWPARIVAEAKQETG